MVAAMRVYLPLTLPGLAQLHRTGETGPAPLTAYAVTPTLRAWYVAGGEEELEYAALGRAAAHALRLLADDPDAPPRRVVLAADVPEATAAPDPEAIGRVRLTAPVPLADSAAVHLDADDAEADVAAAAAALPAADSGDDDARFAVDGAEDHELLWYAVQEIGGLVAPAGP